MADPTLAEKFVKVVAAMLWEERYLRDHIIAEADFKRIVEGAGLKALKEE